MYIYLRCLKKFHVLNSIPICALNSLQSACSCEQIYFFNFGGIVYYMHSNDSHQCPILAADLFWDRKWIAYLYPSLTSRPCLDGFFIFCPIIKNNKVSCQYGTLMWIIAVTTCYLLLNGYYRDASLVHISLVVRYTIIS